MLISFRLLLLASLILLPLLPLNAEPLQRAGLLGIAPAPAQEGEDSAVRVGQIAPNSTASKLGLKPNDELISVNGEHIQNFGQVVALVQQMTAHDSLAIQIQRNGIQHTLKGSLQPRPYETSTNAKVHYEEVFYDHNRLRSIVHTPDSLRAGEQAPAIFYIQGYTCGSIDTGMSPQSALSRLVHQFTEAGYVVFRVEKPGVGDSLSPRPCSAIDFSTESLAFVHALRSLKKRQDVDPDRIFLWGHSLGVLHSAVVADQEPVAGIIGYGGVFKNWYEYLLDIYKVQSVKHFSIPQEEAERNAATVQPFLDLWLNSKQPWDQVTSDESAQAALTSNLLPIAGDQVFNRHYRFFRDLNRYDFAKLWRNSGVPILMIHGSLDIQAISPDWAYDIVAANGQPNSSALVIEGAEHAFLRYPDSQAYRTAREQGRFNPISPGTRFDQRIVQHSLNWISGLE